MIEILLIVAIILLIITNAGIKTLIDNQFETAKAIRQLAKNQQKIYDKIKEMI